MVVDDEPQVGKCLARLLRRQYQVTTVTSGAEALEQLAVVQPDIIISDFRMPAMNGAELIAEVRSRRPEAAAVLLTGYSELEWGFDELAGHCKFVRKPWDDRELLALLQSLLESRAARQG